MGSGWKIVEAPAGAPVELQTAPLGIYLHIPFCERKCPYCDFNTYAGLEAHHAAMVDALCTELATWQDRLAERTVTSVFVGGGTPTVLDGEMLVQLFAALRGAVELAERCEITCEANPGTVDRAKFGLLRELGVNRLSMGVQSFQPDELSFLGRIHDVADVYRAAEAARAAGFDNLNLDFIFGLPGQREEAWEDTLGQALALQPDHLSLYSLIVEENTPLFHWVANGQVAAPDDDVAAALYEMALARLADAGYAHYEVSNWARAHPADDHIVPARASRHNLLYWRNQEYVGIGPGAHSHLREVTATGEIVGRRWGNRKPVQGYIRRMARGEPVEEFSERILAGLAMGETMMLGLRLVCEGVPLAHFRALHGVDLREVYGRELDELTAQDLLRVDGERVRVTPRGLMVGNQVFAAFLPDA